MSPVVSLSFSFPTSHNTLLTTSSRIDLRPSRNTSDTTANSAGDSLPEPLTDETNDTAAYGSHIPSPNDLQRAWRSGLKKSIAALRRL